MDGWAFLAAEHNWLLQGLMQDNFPCGSLCNLNHKNAGGGHAEGAGALTDGFFDEPPPCVKDTYSVIGAALNGDAAVACTYLHV